MTKDVVAIKKFKVNQGKSLANRAMVKPHHFLDDELVRKTSHREVRILNALKQENIIGLKVCSVELGLKTACVGVRMCFGEKGAYFWYSNTWNVTCFK